MHIFIGFFIITLVLLLIGSLSNSQAQNNLDRARDNGLKVADSEYAINLQKELNDSLIKIVEQHESTLAEKRKQLVFVNDYGKDVVDGWHQELDYFFNHVLLGDSRFSALLDESLEIVNSSYAEQGVIVPQEVKERLRREMLARLNAHTRSIVETILTPNEN